MMWTSGDVAMQALSPQAQNDWRMAMEAIIGAFGLTQAMQGPVVSKAMWAATPPLVLVGLCVISPGKSAGNMTRCFASLQAGLVGKSTFLEARSLSEDNRAPLDYIQQILLESCLTSPRELGLTQAMIDSMTLKKAWRLVCSLRLSVTFLETVPEERRQRLALVSQRRKASLRMKGVWHVCSLSKTKTLVIFQGMYKRELAARS